MYPHVNTIQTAITYRKKKTPLRTRFNNLWIKKHGRRKKKTPKPIKQNLCHSCKLPFIREQSPCLISKTLYCFDCYDKTWNKDRCRSLTLIALSKGMLNKTPCDCGATKSIHAHHEDYSHPMRVNWMCRSCHMIHHKMYWALPKTIQ